MNRTVTDLFVRPDYDRSAVSVTFTPPEGCRSAEWQIIDRDRVIQEGRVETRPGEEVAFEAQIEGFRPWNVQTPYLYTFGLTLACDQGPVEISQAFGMRKFHATSDALYVNNERVFLRGHIRGREAHDHPNLEGLPLEEYYAKNIRAGKALGFNLIRFHSQVPPEECFSAADRLGMFIHVEIRKYFGKYPKERSNLVFEGELVPEDQWREMVLRLRNHPSLMVYCMGNEIDNPGANPYVAHIARVTKQIDPTRFFLDTCGRGEFDRENVDLTVQHMSYFYPFGKNYDMFENPRNWLIYGSARGLDLISPDTQEDVAGRVTRSLAARQPVIAHEICHYTALRDVEVLDRKFRKTNAQKPWWIDELKKLIRTKGMEQDYPAMLEAGRRFQFLSWKLGIEAARRSPLLSGFHFLQLSDTDRYENGNGILDCFDDSKGTPESEFLKFNADSVLLADLPRRTCFEREKVTVPIILSHFSAEIGGMAGFAFSLKSCDGSAVAIRGGLEKISLDERGRREICRVELRLPAVEKPQALTLTCKLAAEDGSYIIENDWNLWLYPNRPRELPAPDCTIALDEVVVTGRYPQLQSSGTLDVPAKLLIVNRFSAPVLRHLERGGDVLLLYRVPETRDRRAPAEKETWYLPATWDRFKAVVWDRGTNCGAFMRDSRLWDGFPHDGFMDLQFHALVNDCDKVCLDDFPCALAPIMQGVDKAVRDRFDVYTYKLSEFQPKWTLRKFAYLFELAVGDGRLFVSGFNFIGLAAGIPETCAMFEAILRYVTSDAFRPSASLSPRALETYLIEKGRAPRIKERRMTQFWQLDDEPLELRKYWKESIEYLGEKPLQPDDFLGGRK